MPLTVTVPTTWYSLPREGAQAQADFLALLALPVETYVMAFTLTLAPALAALEALAAAGVPVHVLLDRSQCLMCYETPKVRAFMAAMPAGSVVLTTAGPDSPRPSVIMHRKSACKLTTPVPTLWKGSANPTAEGFMEGNECACCQSAELAAEFVADFAALETWALAHVDQTLPAVPAALGLETEDWREYVVNVHPCVFGEHYPMISGQEVPAPPGDYHLVPVEEGYEIA